MLNFKNTKIVLFAALASMLILLSIVSGCSPKTTYNDVLQDTAITETQTENDEQTTDEQTTDEQEQQEEQQNTNDQQQQEPVVEQQTVVKVTTPDELVTVFENLEPDTVISIEADLDMTGKTIKAVNARCAFTLNGNGKTISNLTTTEAGLFVAKAGSDAYAFNDVNLKNCTVTSPLNQGALFVGDGEMCGGVTISNCKAEDCTVSSEKYAAAFVAYTSGYRLKDTITTIEIAGCSVIGGSITGKGSTGAAIGHSGSTAETINNITDLTVKNVAINGEDAEHTGIAVGTANTGITNISNVSVEGVTGNFNPEHQIYGRAVLNDTGKLNIDGTEIQ